MHCVDAWLSYNQCFQTVFTRLEFAVYAKLRVTARLSLDRLAWLQHLSHSHLTLHWITRLVLLTHKAFIQVYVCGYTLTMFQVHWSDGLTRELPSTYAYANPSQRVEQVHLLSRTAYTVKSGRFSLDEGPSWLTGWVVDDETAGTGSGVGLRDPVLTQHRNHFLCVHVQ